MKSLNEQRTELKEYLIAAFNTSQQSFNNPIFKLTKFGEILNFTVHKLGGRRLCIHHIHSGKDDKKYTTVVVREYPTWSDQQVELFRFHPTGVSSEIEFAMPYYSRTIRGTDSGCVIRMMDLAGVGSNETN